MIAIATVSNVVCKIKNSRSRSTARHRASLNSGNFYVKTARLGRQIYVAWRLLPTAMRPAGRSRERDDLARIEDVLRVQRALHRGHDGERGGTMLGQKVLHLALPHPVLAG